MPPLNFTGGQNCEILARFATPVAFHILHFRNEAMYRASNTNSRSVEREVCRLKMSPENLRHWGSFVTPKFWDTLRISGTAEATNFKVGVQVVYEEYYRKMQNDGTKGRGLGHVTYL